MCELFGISARYPTDVNHSLALLRPRGGAIGPHADGWGVAFYEGSAARVFKEPIPAAESRCLAFISEYDFKSTTVVAHIRKANPVTIGRASANTHPFERELAGRSWVFAHNGKLPGLRDDADLQPSRFLPIGQTDSELAFCMLLDQLENWIEGPHQLEPRDLVAAVGGRVERLAALRECVEHNCDQRVTLLATAPLTDEPWQELAHGKLHVYSAGKELLHA